MLEGDPNDRVISTNYFLEKGIPFKFIQASNDVLPFLNGKIKNQLLLPKLILLSMHSIPDTGLHVLEQIMTQTSLKHIPVIVLSENTQPDLIKICYERGANTFIKKPFTNTQTDIKIKSFLHYWFDVAEFSEPTKIQYS